MRLKNSPLTVDLKNETTVNNIICFICAERHCFSTERYCLFAVGGGDVILHIKQGVEKYYGTQNRYCDNKTP